MVTMMNLDKINNVTDFAKAFLKSRYNWWACPKINSIINFGNIISLLLFRQQQYQVELFIVPHSNSHFTAHRHPDVDVIEFGLCGSNRLFVKDCLIRDDVQMAQWLAGQIATGLVSIKPTDWHYGDAVTPYSFLSLQHWLNGVQPSSVGLNWEGESASIEQEDMLIAQRNLDSFDSVTSQHIRL
jgi:hypothetical protein